MVQKWSCTLTFALGSQPNRDCKNRTVRNKRKIRVISSLFKFKIDFEQKDNLFVLIYVLLIVCLLIKMVVDAAVGYISNIKLHNKIHALCLILDTYTQNYLKNETKNEW